MSAFEGWAVVELLGHRVRYGRVTEVTMFGEAFCRIEIPTEPPTVEHYSGKALYGIREASEATIRAYHAPRRALPEGEVVVDDADWDADEEDCPDDYELPMRSAAKPDDESGVEEHDAAAPIGGVV